MLIAFQAGRDGLPALRIVISVLSLEHVLSLDGKGGVAAVHILLWKGTLVVQSMEDVNSCVIITMEFALVRQATLSQVL